MATTVVRALDDAGITVDDVALHQPSLDDVFALTGHPTVEVGGSAGNGAEPASPELEVERT